MKKVAIVQPRIGYGGRLRVILSLTELLNERDIIPDFITASVPSPESIKEKYNRIVRFNFVKLLSPVLPSDLDVLQFHLRIRSLISSYDLIINHSNSNIFMPTDVPVIYYVYFPRKRRAECLSKSIHLPGMQLVRGHPLRLYKALLRNAYEREIIGENVFVVAISSYVRNVVAENFDVPDTQMTVVYPPVDTNQFTPSAKRKERIATLGRFKAYKRQLQQMRIAARLPEMQFIIMGFVSSRSYFRQCKRYREKHHLDNVKLYPNAPFGDLRRTLETSKIFMHNVVNEPFGLTTVQAIAAGCIPVVHDSGGQREIVSDKALRFSTPGEAASILQQLRKESEGKETQKKLRAHVDDNFSEEAYRRQMQPILDEYL
jgi:glycosyltransferase involved in cell wall biosynthesis